MSRRLLTACFCALALGVPAIPQQQANAPKQTTPPQDVKTPAQDDPIFTSRSDEVIVPVTVTDYRGKYVSNLEANDFRILDEGKPQKITFFSHDQKQPVVIGFIVDTSSGMRIHWKTFQEAIRELVWALLPGDNRYSGYLITAGNDAELAVNTTNDSDKIAEKILLLKPGGNAALFDSIYRACTDRKLVPGEPYEPRRIIIIIGDGHDTSSKKSMEEVLELAQRNLVTIYAISTENFGFSNPDKDTLEKLVEQTGGRVEYPLSNLYKDVSGYLSHPSDDGNYALTVGSGAYASEIAGGILKAVGGISGDIAQQYVMRYRPSIDDTKTRLFRRIKVDLPQYPNTNIRFKPGYFPFPARGAAATNQ